MSKDSVSPQQHTSVQESHVLEGSGFENSTRSSSAPAFQLMASPSAPPIQRKASSGSLPTDLVHGFAASTGHDLSNVNVHYNSSAPSQVGALAYAQGNDIHLGAGQEQHLAHEAAHVVQQREGRVTANTQVNGMPVNDNKGLESEADSMGAKATQMKAAPIQAKLISSTSSGPAQRKVIQRYAPITAAAQNAREWNAGEDLRVADNGMTATSELTSSKKAYAHPSLIAQSNRELAARGSGVVLEEQSESLRGSAPNGSGRHTLKRVLPRMAFSNNGGTGTGQSSWADCGRMSREVMGQGGMDQSPHGVFENSAGNLQETAATSSPEEQRNNILVAAGLGATPAAALTAYQAMSATDRDTFDRRHGLNRYAAPSVGEAFTTHSARGFNFHWGGVVFNSGGGDRVTLENFYKGGTYSAQDTQWYFQTYGSASHAGQTWHDQWNDGSAGSFSARTSTRSISGATNAAGVRLVDSPANWDDPAHYEVLPSGTRLQKTDTNNSRWIQVRVTAGPSNGHTGYIMAHFFQGD